MRGVCKDRFPVIGAVAEAEYLADRLTGAVWSLPGDSAAAPSPERFARWFVKKGLPSA
ncbi:MAG: hypothetical protein HYS17_03965 [Micavibrio aeruginosavorus]|uniref:Uncharacterized protein n=1 Tax=Micavibrio aeruginosavorus TaxID=349221 RepID=A0A7T5UIF3_9BACT|nr:MAG: hypothetical protein HYS17_03965 [Micavibrio aeruginosavorus]